MFTLLELFYYCSLFNIILFTVLAYIFYINNAPMPAINTLLVLLLGFITVFLVSLSLIFFIDINYLYVAITSIILALIISFRGYILWGQGYQDLNPYAVFTIIFLVISIGSFVYYYSL